MSSSPKNLGPALPIILYYYESIQNWISFLFRYIRLGVLIWNVSLNILATNISTMIPLNCKIETIFWRKKSLIGISLDISMTKVGKCLNYHIYKTNTWGALKVRMKLLKVKKRGPRFLLQTRHSRKIPFYRHTLYTAVFRAVLLSNFIVRFFAQYTFFGTF